MKKALVFLSDFRFLNPAIEKKCKDYTKILIVQKNKFIETKEKSELFDAIYKVDEINDLKEMENLIDIINKKYEVVQIITSYEMTVDVAGYLRDRLSLSGLCYETSLNVRDKVKMKTVLSNAKIPVARFRESNSLQDTQAFLQEVDFPIILKRRAGAATEMTFKVKDDKELKDIYSKYDLPNYMVEEYISGKEYHIDTIIQDGQIIFASVGGYLSNCLDCVQGSGKVASIIYPPKNMSTPLMKQLCELNQKAIQALGVDNTICHAEYFVTSYGDIYFGEVAARIGGGSLISSTIESIYNIDLYEKFIDVHLGSKIEIPDASNHFAGFMCFDSMQGIITKISEPKDFSSIAGLYDIQIDKKIGDEIFNQFNTVIRCGHIVIEDKSFSSLEYKLYKAANEFFVCVK